MLAELALTASTATGVTTLATGLYARTLFRRLHTDSLTGLANRLDLQRVFNRVQRLSLAGQHIGLLLGDVDRFKTINDTHGHRTGDTVLTGIATTLTQHTQTHEMPARLHGDEFAILVTTVDSHDQAERRARELSTAITRTHHVISGQPFTVSVSLGAATAPARTADLSALLHQADTAMYQHKQEHRLSTVPTRATPRPRDQKEAA